jgi:hypothetical protein
MLSSQKFNKEIYPEDFTEDDKERFDILLKQAECLFPNLVGEQWLMKTAILAFMRKEKNGDTEPSTDEEIEAMKKQYTSDTVFFTPPIETKE